MQRRCIIHAPVYQTADGTTYYLASLVMVTKVVILTTAPPVYMQEMYTAVRLWLESAVEHLMVLISAA